ncbi:NAD(P)H azoreductase [Paraburkholderia nemoris]|uniref:NmrA family NAD(P)-binding protein n=1 Tax=Paraburkholderia nemoris TaxID=2793076 RepID=UPI001912BE2A|nr:NmrA family NAD(P)-binding protein [Paraburkholderia nemoris]MBK5148557.1 NmrA family NAD(P)-binding protein [Burkholderia sp. R-69608]CAE6906315.1 NAD(P)H azoreductase [Paraburkholderia nemoris]
MSDRKIFVAGATGDTGGAATEALVAAGEKVRTLVRKEDERSERLQALGVEVLVGNLSILDDVARALEGIFSAYFVYPIESGGIQATAYFAQAARETGVNAIVNMSQISARRIATSHAARDHWISERVFDWAGTPVTHIRPTFFAQWLTYPGQVANIKKDGVLRLPFGNGRHAPIAAEDQGRVIAAILRDPAPHAGKVYPLYGPVEMNHYEIAEEMGKALGCKVEYQPIDLDMFKKRLDTDSKFSDAFAQHLLSVAVDYQDGVFAGTNTVVEDLTGTPPMTVETFIRKHAARFAS